MTASTVRVPPFRAAGATDVGRQRSVNEDRFHVDPARGIFIVVDGIGGHAAGDRAADAAIAAMTERLERETGAVPDRVREAITIANNEIYRLAATRADWRGMACVLTALVVDGDRFVIGHVGDSRLYRIQGDQIEKLTPDHSPVGRREDANQLTEAEAMRHPRRNEVYRDVGSEPREVGDPDFVFVTDTDLPLGGALLICSDGLTDLVASDRIRQIAAAHAGSPDQVAGALIAAANEAGGKDNVTVVYVEEGAHDRAPVETAHGALRADPTGRSRGIRAVALGTAALAGFALALITQASGWPVGTAGTVLPSTPAGRVVVRADESIMNAISRASPGTEVTVEPGEYRERITLADNIRVVSRVPRGATIRLPSTATEQDAAVTAAGIVNAELSGFRIVGDAATPLGTGVLAHDAGVRLVDLEVTGAVVAAFDLSAGEGLLLAGSHIHDNPGAALILRRDTTARLTNNVFMRNAASERSPAMIAVEAGSAAVWLHNVFSGISPSALGGFDAAARSSLVRDNWFIQGTAPKAAPGASSGRGRAR